VPAEAAPAAANAEPAAEPAPAGTEEEEISFASIVDRMAVPKGEERESEDYGEDEDEEYEIPTTVVTESRPPRSASEDLIREEPEDATRAKTQRGSSGVHRSRKKGTTWTTSSIPAGSTNRRMPRFVRT
jgi:hypothetical protein